MKFGLLCIFFIDFLLDFIILHYIFLELDFNFFSIGLFFDFFFRLPQFFCLS
jgi:hypothetical protein